MEIDNHQPISESENSPSPINWRDGVLTFVGFSVGNIIADHLFHLDFSDASAAPRAAIATGLLYGSKHIWNNIKH